MIGSISKDKKVVYLNELEKISTVDIDHTLSPDIRGGVGGQQFIHLIYPDIWDMIFLVIDRLLVKKKNPNI